MAKKDFKICMTLTNELNHDTRVINEANSLGQYFDVTILVPKEAELTVDQTNFKVKEIPYPKRRSFIKTMIAMILEISRAAQREDTDVYHAHDLDGLYAAFLPALFKRKILIYDSHELWSDLPPFSEIKRWKWLLPILERLVAWRIDGGITINQSIADVLSQRFYHQFLVSRNVPTTEENKLAKKADFDFDLVKNKDFIIHLGSTGQWRGMDEIITAAKHLPSNVKIVFLGANKGIARFQELAEKLKVQEKIVFHPPVPPDQILAVAKKAKIGLTLTQNASLDYYYSTPNKLFQYVSAGVPILGSDFPEFRQVIINEKIGEVVDPANQELIAKKIIHMLQPAHQAFYRKNLASPALKDYNWEKESEKIIDFYKAWWLRSKKDYTLGKYRQLCQALINHYPVLTFQETLSKNPPKSFAILRHDVDRLPQNALEMAELEAEMGLRASYYFRQSQLKTDQALIKKIASLGHEIGYHYECLDEAKGNTRQALEIFKSNLEHFRRLASIKTIAMHGNPLTRFNNRHLWQHHDFKKFNLVGETYLSLANGTFYYSDTGRTWSNRFKIKDVPVRTNHEHTNFKVESTDDLINFIEKSKVERICVVTHPERWNDNWFKWLGYLCFDRAVRMFKSIRKS